MNIHIEQPQSNRQRAPAQTPVQNQHNDAAVCQLEDNRPETAIQRKMQDMANAYTHAKQLNAFSNNANLSGNSAIQLYNGAVGTNQSGAVIPFTLDQEFTDKHVASSQAAAITKTQARIDDQADLGGAMIRAGTIGNTVATNAVWTAAINGNGDVIPASFFGPDDEDKAQDDYNAADYDESAYAGNSSYMAIAGWDVKLASGALVATAASMNRRVAGTYDVTNLDVSIELNHCTQ